MEIARKLGVSHMTVSRAFMDDESISPETRKRILDTCLKHGYSPSPLGRALRKGTTSSLCVVVPSIHHDAYSRLFDGVQKKALERGYYLTIFKPKMEGLLTLSEAIFLGNHKFDGIVLDTLCDSAAVEFLKELKTPIVTVVERITGGDDAFYFIGTDDVTSARKVVQHLVSIGRRKLVHLAGFPGICGTMRKKGFIEQTRESDLGVCSVIRTGWTFEAGYRKTLELIDSKIRFDAIFGCNDHVAAGAVHALYERKFRIPDDVSLVGFSGDALSEALYPPLSTVVQPFEKIGFRAAEILFEMIRTKARIKGKEIFENTFMIRGSSTLG